MKAYHLTCTHGKRTDETNIPGRCNKVTPTCSIHMNVGSRGEIPGKLYRFPLGGGNLAWHHPQVPDTTRCTCAKRREGVGDARCMTLRSRSTTHTLMTQTPCQWPTIWPKRRCIKHRARSFGIRSGRHAHAPGSSSASCCCNGSVG